jgi:hypothetical protein
MAGQNTSVGVGPETFLRKLHKPAAGSTGPVRDLVLTTQNTGSDAQFLLVALHEVEVPPTKTKHCRTCSADLKPSVQEIEQKLKGLWYGLATRGAYLTGLPQGLDKSSAIRNS